MTKFVLIYATCYEHRDGEIIGPVVGEYDSIKTVYMVKSTLVALTDEGFWSRLVVKELGGEE